MKVGSLKETEITMKTLINFGILVMLVVLVVVMSGGSFESLKNSTAFITLKVMRVIDDGAEKLDAYNEKLDKEYADFDNNRYSKKLKAEREALEKELLNE